MGVVGEGLSWVGGQIFGDEEGPGAMGTGQYKAKPHSINQQAFNNPVGDQSQNWAAGMGGMLGATTGGAPSATAAQLGGAQTYGGAKIGPTAQAGGANVGPTATYGGAQLDQSQFQNIMQQQQAAANQQALQAQGLGPSVAQVQAQQQAQSNMQQQAALLGSQRGSSNPALAQRAALDAGANAQQQAAQQAVLGRTQEVLGAQTNYANMLAGMGNQTSQWAQGQAGLTQQAQLASMGALNSQNLAQAQLAQQNQQFNTGALNSQQLAQAQLYQQAQMGNQDAMNQFMLQQGQMNQQANLANMQSQLAQNQLNAQQYNQYMDYLQQQNLAQYQGQMAGQQLEVNQVTGLAGANQAGYANAAAARGKLAGGILSAIGGAAMSDRRSKKNIGDASAEVNRFLEVIALMSGAE